MKFERIDPAGSDKQVVECYWTVEDDTATPHLQKIIPDGFPEIIFHFGDHYKINLETDGHVSPKVFSVARYEVIFSWKIPGGLKFSESNSSHPLPAHSSTLLR